MGEASQYIILADDALAIELGADIHAAVTDVFINADGIKKSISDRDPAPHHLRQVVAAAAQVVGLDTVRQRSCTGARLQHPRTVTESAIFDRVAEAFEIRDWPVVAVKAFFGHTMGTASGDQVANSLGFFATASCPASRRAERFADDIFADRLALSSSDRQLEPALRSPSSTPRASAATTRPLYRSPRNRREQMARRHQAQDDYVQRREEVRHQAAE